MNEAPAMAPSLLYFLVINLLTLALFARDKLKARQGQRRTPESTLIGTSLAGGWPAGVIGMAVFSHKTRNRGFQLSYGLGAIANIVATLYLTGSI